MRPFKAGGLEIKVLAYSIAQKSPHIVITEPSGLKIKVALKERIVKESTGIPCILRYGHYSKIHKKDIQT